jgi:hypothetical protein
MVGGMLSSTFLTLIVIPAIYTVVKLRALRPAKTATAVKPSQRRPATNVRVLRGP